MGSSIHTAGWWKVLPGAVVGAVLAGTVPWAIGDSEQTPTVPIADGFWPSGFGADDQRGATNRITPETVVRSARLVKDGRNEAYGAGIGLAAAKFLTDRKVSMIGADTWAIEALPHERDELAYPVHQWNLTRHGVYHIENLDLEELAADGVHEFCFVFSPLRLKGATGSPGNPIAVR